MSRARAAACSRLALIRAAVKQFNLRDLPLITANEAHNASVRIIRNGLAVQCFNVFEDFVRGRTVEVLTQLSAVPVTFAHLPEGLRSAATLDVFRAVNFQLRLRDKANHVSFVQDYSAKVASTANGPLELPDLAFFNSRSNVSAEDYKKTLGAFGVDKPFVQVTGIGGRLGMMGAPAATVFHSFADRRHRAAHDATASVSESDLDQSLTDAMALAIGFDVLLSKAAGQLRGLSSAPSKSYRSIRDQAAIPIRTIRPVRGGFAERKLGNTRNSRVGPTVAGLRATATRRAQREGGVLVVFEHSGVVTAWET